ncbi:MAG: GDSL-type esterase/lipase family protein [Pseudomonadota bacterium]|nr:GDSL-type esterase/lipase family protein [Pseudomonadota bacterium]
MLTAVLLSVVSPTAVAAQEVPYLSLDRVAAGASVCPGGLCQPEGLAQVFGRLASTEAGGPVPAVRIHQLGDSHTAGGRITGAVRARLQGRFGYAGPAADPSAPTQEEPRSGVLLFEYGEVGATLRDLQTWRDDGTPGGLAPWAADLVVLAFGTNEGFEDGLDGAAYEATLRDEVSRLRALTPRASILILGAPDALRSGLAGGCSADGLRAPPPSLAVVRDVQRRVAADMGVAFWDWHGRMGGDCSADRLALMADPYVRGDRVHFTGAGADWIGGVMAADLLAAYEAWKAGLATAGTGSAD